MDWYSWLSRTKLEPSITHEYAVVFTRNELQNEDMIYFNHEFLLSLGVNVAKHRLEILKLVSKEHMRNPNGLGIGKLVLALNKTKKFFTKNITKWIPQKNSAHMPPLELSNHSKPWTRPLKRGSSGKEQKLEKSLVNRKSITQSGPLDSAMLKEMMIKDKWISLSGSLDGKFYQEKWMSMNRSPTRYGYTDGIWRETLVYGSKSPSNYRPWQGRSPSPLARHYYGGSLAVGDGNLSPWSLMFHDMKPT